ncbi:MAG: HAD family hydrolase [Chloroflexota bacterium]
MRGIKVISFDLEGTLTKPDFTELVWFEGIPSLYARRVGIDFEKAKSFVLQKYEEVGDRRKEWYDIKYWFDLFGLQDYQGLLDSYKDRVTYYPDVLPVLSSLSGKYKLIVTTNAASEFLPYLLGGIRGYFVRTFSSISECGQLKSAEYFASVCQVMGIHPDEMAHVGDSWEFDVIAARGAGVKAFHLDRAKGTDNADPLKSLLDLETRLGQPE